MSRSNFEHTFSRIPSANIERSTFTRSHSHKTTFNSGYLIPFYVDEILPGDTFSVKGSFFARLATPTVPVMDNLVMDIFYFFVPNRLVWTHWPNFMGELEDPDDLGVVDYIVPKLSPPSTPGIGLGSNTIYDYMGIPVGVYPIEFNALPFRAYNLIWNEWFRHQDLQSKAPVIKDDGGTETIGDYQLLRRNKRHDYFTASLPWPQKGPGVMLPLGTTAPVIGDTSGATPSFISNGSSGLTGQLGHKDNVSDLYLYSATGGPESAASLRWQNTGLVADLSDAAAATINSLRQAFQLQKLYERDARGGTRYTEMIRAHFGVVSPDARLQRPEYLGGGSIPVILTPIPQNSATGTYADTPQANLAAVGHLHGSSIGFTKSFVEHGFVLGLLEVRADLHYQQGLNRMWSRKTKMDYYFPVMAHLGEQAVLNKEIYAQGTAEDDAAWGYQERWAEYRYYPSMITGNMRSKPFINGAVTESDSLAIWHFAQDFDNLPTLSDQFMQDTPPVSRSIALLNKPEFWADFYIDVRATRPMPVYSVPGLIDHF